MKRKIKKYTLLAHAIEIMIKTPEITIQEFSERIGKRYSHAGNLMHQARRHLGRHGWERPTKVDKTMALLSLLGNVKMADIQRLTHVSYGRAAELKSIARKRLSTGRTPSSEALKWAQKSAKSPLAKPEEAEP